MRVLHSRRFGLALVGAFAVSVAVFACKKPKTDLPCGGNSLDERAFWRDLAIVFQQCAVDHDFEQCRTKIESREWNAVTTTSGTQQELHGTIAGGGSTYPSPNRAPEGDFCISHDDIDFNFNVSPDPAYASYLQPGNLVADVDHPASVVETEWEGMYVDPRYVAKPSGGSSTYKDWAMPAVDMQVGDRVALRGAGVLDCGHAPYRSEIHPPYLSLWGAVRGAATVVYARGSAFFARPHEFAALPVPPAASETLADDFPLPPMPVCSTGAPALSVAAETQWLYDDPVMTVDESCDLTNGLSVSLSELDGPTFDAAICSPAAHWTSTSNDGLAGNFFSLTATQTSDAKLHVALTPLSRPHQALYGARVTAAWQCP